MNTTRAFLTLPPLSERLRTRLLIALAVLITGLLLTDCFGGHVEHVPGTVTGRHYTPPYDELVCSTNTQTNTIECHEVHHDADYSLYVRTSEGLAYIDTNRRGYDLLADGQPITYKRIRTRWTDYTWGSSYYLH